jgi:hypothetical protein
MKEGRIFYEGAEVDKPAAPSADDPKKAAVAYGDTRRPARAKTTIRCHKGPVNYPAGQIASCYISIPTISRTAWEILGASF